MKTCGIVGIGHLGRALTKQFETLDVDVFAYHPNLQKRFNFSTEFKNVKAVDFLKLLKQPIILLALPAEEIKEFLINVKKEISSFHKLPIFVNLSTLVDTNELKKEFSEFLIYGVKMIGHANYLYENGNGVFLTETPLNKEDFQEVRYLFESIGSLFEDHEDIVQKINGLAVETIIEACMKFEKGTKDYPKEYSNKAIDTIFPNTMKLYREKSFDGHMLSVMKDIEKKSYE